MKVLSERCRSLVLYRSYRELLRGASIAICNNLSKIARFFKNKIICTCFREFYLESSLYVFGTFTPEWTHPQSA
jgi:hypothetical protein